MQWNPHNTLNAMLLRHCIKFFKIWSREPLFSIIFSQNAVINHNLAAQMRLRSSHRKSIKLSRGITKLGSQVWWLGSFSLPPNMNLLFKQLDAGFPLIKWVLWKELKRSIFLRSCREWKIDNNLHCSADVNVENRKLQTLRVFMQVTTLAGVGDSILAFSALKRK